MWCTYKVYFADQVPEQDALVRALGAATGLAWHHGEGWLTCLEPEIGMDVILEKGPTYYGIGTSSPPTIPWNYGMASLLFVLQALGGKHEYALPTWAGRQWAGGTPSGPGRR